MQFQARCNQANLPNSASTPLPSPPPKKTKYSNSNNNIKKTPLVAHLYIKIVWESTSNKHYEGCLHIPHPYIIFEQMRTCRNQTGRHFCHKTFPAFLYSHEETIEFCCERLLIDWVALKELWNRMERELNVTGTWTSVCLMDGKVTDGVCVWCLLCDLQNPNTNPTLQQSQKIE